MTPHTRAFRCVVRGASPGGALLLALALLGSGCARPAPEDHATAVERAACNQHAETVYTMRNPDEVYRSDTYDTSIRDAPFAGAGFAGPPNAGLSSQYQHDQLVSDCLNGGNGTVGAAPAAPSPEESPAPKPAQP
jgi:hypothetical protein